MLFKKQLYLLYLKQKRKRANKLVFFRMWFMTEGLLCFSLPNNSFQAPLKKKNYVMSLSLCQKNKQDMNLTSHAWWEPGKIVRMLFTSIQKVTELIVQDSFRKWVSREPWTFEKLMCVHSKCTCAHTSNKSFYKRKNIVSTWFYHCLFKRELCKSTS